ncbi:hypothetical protein [Microbulbifer sp. S227A]|uniref:hypothetical protein n=1 Tax=Microbulbifer sp. S227A TaxID=3415131 RepID=UPI003C7DA1E4
MPERIEERLSKLEHDKTRVIAAMSVLALLGIGVGGYASYLSTNFAQVSNKVVDVEGAVAQTSIDLAAVEDKIPDIPTLVDEAVTRRVEVDLSEGWASYSVLAQLQAQAVCTAIAPKNTTVAAVERAQAPSGSNTSELCQSLCPRFKMLGTGRPGQDVGAVHIYNKSPAFVDDPGNPFQLGFSTHVYPSGNTNTGYGPNYCCCAG